MPSLSEILDAKSRVMDRLLRPRVDPDEKDSSAMLAHNFTGAAPAYKITKGVQSTDLCLAIFVRSKLPDDFLGKYNIRTGYLRDRIGDIPTDVVETGSFRPAGGAAVNAKTAVIGMGADVSMAGRATHGTLCAFAHRGNECEPYLLSSAHVLDGHAGLFRLVVSGNEVVADIQSPADQATLLPADIQDPSVKFCPNHQQDAVLARLRCQFDPIFRLPGGGHLSSPTPLPAEIGMCVEKRGKTVSRGFVWCRHATVAVDYPTQTAVLQEQIVVKDEGETFAVPGDSGALVVTVYEEALRAVGMVIAAGDASSLLDRHRRVRPGFTIVSPLGDVLGALNASLLIRP